MNTKPKGPVTEVTLWVCDECGYSRMEEKTGVHVAYPDSGPGRRHELTPVTFVRKEDETE